MILTTELSLYPQTGDPNKTIKSLTLLNLGTDSALFSFNPSFYKISGIMAHWNKAFLIVFCPYDTDKSHLWIELSFMTPFLGNRHLQTQRDRHSTGVYISSDALQINWQMKEKQTTCQWGQKERRQKRETSNSIHKPLPPRVIFENTLDWCWQTFPLITNNKYQALWAIWSLLQLSSYTLVMQRSHTQKLINECVNNKS